MAKARCFISTSHDPFLNIATEEWLFNNLKDEHTLYLWRNKDTVIIGRNQNAWAECDNNKMERDSVSLVRRHSGGGAVFQDLGNTIFSFISSKTDHDRKKNYDIILKALRKFGVKAKLSGRNDVVVKGRKISGNAYKESQGTVLHHGTLLVDVDMSRLSGYLTPSRKKLVSKGTTSVKARVDNLVNHNPEINHENLSNAIMEIFFSTHKSGIIVDYLDEEKMIGIPEIRAQCDFLKSDSWRFGEAPDFEHHLEERFDWGTLSIHLDVQQGLIRRNKIFSDSMKPELIEELERSLKNVKYDSTSILERLSTMDSGFRKEMNDIRAWLKNQV